MQKATIKVLNEMTYEVCQTYLTGAFDYKRNHRPALDMFRHEERLKWQDLCTAADEGCQRSLKSLEHLVISLLLSAKTMYFDDILYSFSIQDFKCKKTLEYLVQDVIAQVNDY